MTSDEDVRKAVSGKLITKYSDAEWSRMNSELKRRAEALVKKSQGRGNREERIVANAAIQMIEHENPLYLKAISQLKRFPVTIDEFIESPEFLGSGTENEIVGIWPTLRQELRNMNPDVMAGESAVTEAYLAGATATGKTIRAIVTTMYQLYLLTCFSSPQRLWDLSSATPIVFMFQSVSMEVTKKVIYEPFREMFLAMPYTQRWVEYDKYKESALEIVGNIQCYPTLASVEAMVGQAIIGAVIDEINFLAVVSNSKQATGPNGQGGMYDQAQIAYNTLSRRRENRFKTRGVSIGSLVLSSSIRYVDDFLDRRIDEAIKFKEPYRHISRAKTYEIQPQHKFCGEKFKLLIGNRQYSTRILSEEDKAGVHYPKDARVELVPIEYRIQFMQDPENALRDVCGIATDTITPFITQRDKITEAFSRGTERGLTPYVVKQNVDLLYDGMPVISPNNLPLDKTTLRYIHVDLATTMDRCGIAVVRPKGHTQVVSEDGIAESMPTFEVELAITIKPHPNKELEIAEVRQWIVNLQEIHGIPIACVSYDGFESKESRQLLRRVGVNSKYLSVDRTMEPYTDLRRCLYQNRVDFVPNEILATELANLEFNAKKEKVDHPPRGGKDLADAVAGALFSASQSRVIRSQTTVTGTIHERRAKKLNRRSIRGQRSGRADGNVDNE